MPVSRETRMAPKETETVVPQCGVLPVVDTLRKEEERPKEQEKKEHHWPCSDEFHSRVEVERSRQMFDWKVVEPFDGNLSISI